MESFLARIAPIWTPHRGQREFLLTRKSTKVLACGRRWGKTDACAVETLAALFRYKPTKHILIAPTLDQARILFDRVCELLLELIRHEGSDDKPVIRRSPYLKLNFGDHVLQARSGFLGRALRGHEATHIIIDEAAYLPEEIITEIALPMLATTSGSLTMISTPNGKNHFWRFYQMGLRGENDVWSRTAPSEESPFLKQDFLAIQKHLISDRAFRIEYGAEFIDSLGRVFRTETIDQALVARIAIPEDQPTVIGIDFGRYQDYTAAAALCGHRNECALLRLDRFQQLRGKEQINRLVRFIEHFPGAQVLCDATGAGDPLADQLEDALPMHTLQRIVFTSQVKRELIDNLAWMFENVALKMEPDPMLIRELSHYETKLSSAGNQKFNAASGFHDDLVIALALAARGLNMNYSVLISAAGERRFVT